MSKLSYKVAIHSSSVGEALGRILKRDTHNLLTKIGETVVDQTRDRFYSTKRDPDGKRWAPWKESYAKRNPPGTFLLQSTALAESIHAHVSGTRVSIRPDDCVYAKTHQYGSNKRNITKREFLGLSKQDKNQIDYVAAEWLKGLVK